MDKLKRLPVGVDDFEKLINQDFYYVDKTGVIEEKQYLAKLKQDGMRNFIKYGIACYKKECRVMVGETKPDE